MAQVALHQEAKAGTLKSQPIKIGSRVGMGIFTLEK